MRILQVIASMNPANGGICQGIRNLVPSLIELGCSNEVICLDHLDEAALADDCFPIHAIGISSGAWRYNPRLLPWFEENLTRYDVVIQNGLWQYTSYAVTKAICQLRKTKHASAPKYYVMPHGMLDPWFQQAPSRRVKAWRNWMYWNLLEKQTITTADALLFTCQQELELARKPFRPYRPQRELNIGYGVAEPPAPSGEQADAFNRVCSEIDGSPYLLFLSRIHPKKGVDLLLDAYAQVAAEFSVASPTLPALVVAGPLDSPFAEQMRARAQSHMTKNPSLRIVFPGMLSGDAKWGAFYGCRAFILPSHQENFGVAVVEALACGKPVAISDQVNIHTEIAGCQAGWVESDKYDGVLKLLRRITSVGEQELAQTRVAARACYEQHFLPLAAAERLTKVLSA